MSTSIDTITSTLLGANHVYIQPVQEALMYVDYDAIQILLESDVSGKLYFEESSDQISWTISKVYNSSPGTILKTDNIILNKSYFRFRYANGNISQKRFKMMIKYINDLSSESDEKIVNDCRFGNGNAVITLNNPGTYIQILNKDETATLTATINGISIPVEGYSLGGSFSDNFAPFTVVEIESTGDWMFLVKA